MKSQSVNLTLIRGLALTVLMLAPVRARAEINAAAVARVGGDIQYLASDELEGRGPGTPGLQKAAEHIRDEFKKLGLKSGVPDGSYMQPFEITLETQVVKPKTSLVLHGPDGQRMELELDKDFRALAIGGSGEVTAEIVFAGYGVSAPDLQYDDYNDLDVEGKIVLMIRREPQQDQEKSAFEGKKVTSHSYIRTKIQVAKKNKAAGVLIVNDPFTTKSQKKDSLSPSAGFGSSTMGLPFVHLSQAAANKILASTPLEAEQGKKLGSLEAIEKSIDENLQPVSQSLQGWSAELKCTFEVVKVAVANVVGVLEGEGPLADETIVIGAHYDHLGYGPFGSRRPNERAIHNGADDNASGTACIMELARQFALAETKPKRRMVFIGFSAEERGIIGSNYYVEKPLFPLENTVAMFNFDMIGRLTDQGLTLGGVRSAKEFASLVDAAAEEAKLKVNTSGPTGASDHAGFYRKNIPVIFFWTGLTKDYHTPDDDFEKINVEGVVQTADFAARVIGKIDDMTKRPEFVKSTTRAASTKGGMAYLGVVPDYAGGVDGLRITDVNADSPAAKGGLKKGDVITKIGEVEVADIQGLADGLRKYKPNTKIKIVVKRGEENKTLDVTLGLPQGQR